MFTRLRWVGVLLLLSFSAVVVSVRAQTAGNASLSPPQLDAFPRVRTYLDVHNELGEFVHGLTASDIVLLENGQPVPPLEFIEIRPGLQFVMGINPGAPFEIRNSQGKSRYEFIAESLSQWARSRQGSSIDDLSMVIAGGPERTHFSDPLELANTLDNYELEVQADTPNLDNLFRAIEVASDVTPQDGMERAVLFLTSPLEGDISFGLQELISRANRENIRIYVWYVGSAQTLETPQADLLRGMAEQTGGEFLMFSGEEELPSIESYLKYLRDIYRVTYESQIHVGGTQELFAQIKYGDQQIETPVRNFEFDLQPPDPAFISPSLEVRRTLAERGFVQGEVEAEILVPIEQNYQILIDFPDGRARPIQRTALYVDGMLVDENTIPPFDLFVWDLNTYTTTAQHLLQAEALDSLGLRGTSLETPVQIVVELPEPDPLERIWRVWPAVAGLGLLLIGMAVLLFLIVSGRIRPRGLKVPIGFRGRLIARSDRMPTEVTESQENLRVDIGGRRLSGWANRFHWPHRRLIPEAPAFLTQLEDTNISDVTPYSLTADELTLGSDPSQSIFVVDDPSVEGLHARIVRADDDTYRLLDEGSVAGTWVNYIPIPLEGKILEHGDVIHIGRVSFRYSEREPRRILKPVSRPADSHNE